MTLRKSFLLLFLGVSVVSGCSQQRSSDIILVCIGESQSVDEFIVVISEFAYDNELRVRIRDNSKLLGGEGGNLNLRFNLYALRDGLHVFLVTNRAVGAKEAVVFFNSFNSDEKLRNQLHLRLEQHFNVERVIMTEGVHAGFCPHV